MSPSNRFVSKKNFVFYEFTCELDFKVRTIEKKERENERTLLSKQDAFQFACSAIYGHFFLTLTIESDKHSN